jgi:hypothetical protein
LGRSQLDDIKVIRDNLRKVQREPETNIMSDDLQALGTARGNLNAYDKFTETGAIASRSTPLITSAPPSSQAQNINPNQYSE